MLGHIHYFQLKNKGQGREKNQGFRNVFWEIHHDLHTAPYLSEPTDNWFPQAGFKTVYDYLHPGFEVN